MTQPIDPTMWPKVKGLYPETGTYFRVKSNGETWAGFFQKDGLILTSNGDGFVIETHGPITFAKPVPAPEVTLYLVRTKDGDKWCQADAVDGRKDKILYDVGTCRSRGSIEQANIIRTATLKEQA